MNQSMLSTTQKYHEHLTVSLFVKWCNRLLCR